jgi:hypothetical protein
LPPLTDQNNRYQATIRIAGPSESVPRQGQGLLPAPRYSAGPFHAQPYTGKRNSITPGPRLTPAPADPSKSTCFNCGEIGYFASSCLKPCSMPKINEIEQEEDKAPGDIEATNKDDSDP